MVNMRAVFSAVTAKAIALYDPLYNTQTYKFISQKLMIYFSFLWSFKVLLKFYTLKMVKIFTAYYLYEKIYIIYSDALWANKVCFN